MKFIEYKHDYLEHELNKVHPELKNVLRAFQSISLDFEKVPVITSIFREDSGVHKAGRAIDIRDQHGGSFVYTEEERLALVNYINAVYTRSDNKKTCLWHDAGTGFHFHLQVRTDA